MMKLITRAGILAVVATAPLALSGCIAIGGAHKSEGDCCKAHAAAPAPAGGGECCKRTAQ